jgi:hypothetical protein
MSTKDQNMIIWQKWQDPFGEQEDDLEKIEYDDKFYDDENNDLGVEELIKSDIVNRKQIKVIATPMGIIPINENTASGKIFNFWIGHTNFDITKKIFEIIEKIDGVETLDLFTRYRFRISVGKAFTDSFVMQSIQELVYDYLNKEDNND